MVFSESNTRWLLFLGVVLLAGIVFVVFGRPDLIYRPTSTSSLITGFHNYEWRASPRSVERGMQSRSERAPVKQPVFKRRDRSGTSFRYKKRDVFGETGTVEFVFHPTKGLVKGLYYFPFGRGKDCQKKYRKIEGELSRQFSSVQPDTGQYNKLQVAFCNAVLVGKAQKISRWADPESEASVTLVLGMGESSKDQLVVLYESEEFYEWDRNRPRAWWRYLFPWS